MNAIESIKEELRRVQEAQYECVNKWGYVHGHCRHRYQLLLRKARDLQGSIEWLQAMYAEKE
jgi:hypothetical protein